MSGREDQGGSGREGQGVRDKGEGTEGEGARVMDFESEGERLNLHGRDGI